MFSATGSGTAENRSCRIDILKQVVTGIEFQFKDGMSWDNRSEWHIDHKANL